MYRAKNSLQFSSRPLLVAMMVALCLIASDQASAQTLIPIQQQAVTNLRTASNTVKGQLTLGTAYSGALSTAASSGTIVDPTAYQSATITEGQRNTYNAALTTFNTTQFNGSRQYFEQRASDNIALMQQAISQLASATADLQKVVTVNQMVSAITDVPTARATQTAILNAGIGTEITQQQASAYNASLANVNSYASQAALFMRAAQNQTLTANVDRFVDTYGKDLNYATTTAAYADTAITLAWSDGLQITQAGMLEQYKQSGSAFYTAVTAGFGN